MNAMLAGWEFIARMDGKAPGPVSRKAGLRGLGREVWQMNSSVVTGNKLFNVDADQRWILSSKKRVMARSRTLVGLGLVRWETGSSRSWMGQPVWRLLALAAGGH